MKDYFNKAKKYQKKYNFKMNGNWGQDDETDAFRHAFASADLSMKYPAALTALAGYANEIFDFLVQEQTNQRQNMDLYNNSVGRDIANEIKKQYGEKAVKNMKEEMIEDIIANKIYEKIQNKQLITEINESNPSHYMRNKPTLQEMRDAQKAKIDYYTSKLSQPSNNSKKENVLSSEPSLKEMMASQKERLSGIKERMFSRSLPLRRMHGEIPENYQNKYLKDKKIFTKEQIDAMEPKEKQELQEAIKYQSETIGIPDEKQAKQMSEKSGSGLIYVSGYTRSDGTEVKSYYRSR